MKFHLPKAVFCGVVLIGETLAANGSGTYHITMEGAAPYYAPVVATVPAGNRIQWNNKTATVHSVTHEGCVTGEACAFDSGAVASGNSFSVSPLQPGTYPYYCRLHPIMRGAIMVQKDQTATGSAHNG